MEVLELEFKHIKVLVKKAYEWRAKVNKRNNRLDFFKTQNALKRFRRFLKNPRDKFIPNKNEILLTIVWFTRCPSHTDAEKAVFTFISLIYKLHKSKLSNLNGK